MWYQTRAGGFILVHFSKTHNAKGILADMTTRATQRGGCDRYVDTALRLCAQKLCTWTPWELRDNQDQEEAEDRAESVRLGYVAATRAKDLLVVSASGMGPWEESWLTPVYRAIYLESGRWRTPEDYPHLNAPGWATVLDIPPDNEDAVSVRTGMHRTAAGNRVFWFDPNK